MKLAVEYLAGTPHWLSTPPPPQVAGAVQVPQWSVPPQPSPGEPQPTPRVEQSVGMQVALLLVATPAGEVEERLGEHELLRGEAAGALAQGKVLWVLVLDSTWKSL